MKKYYLFFVMAVLGTACFLVSCEKEKEIPMTNFPVYMVTLNGKTVDLAFNYQEKIQLVAVVSPGNVKVKDVEWVTDDATVCSCDNGLLTGLKEGKAIITAKSKEDPTKTATCNVNVTFKKVLLEGVSLTKADHELNAGETVDLSPFLKVEPQNPKTTNNTYRWSSSVPRLASIDEVTGVLTAKLPGTVKVEVKATEKHNFMGKDSTFVYTAYMNVKVKGTGELVYAYTDADIAACTYDSYDVNANPNTWFYATGSGTDDPGTPEIFIEDFTGDPAAKIGKVVNLNFRTGWAQPYIRVLLPVNKTVVSNRIEVDFLIPEGRIGDTNVDHCIYTRFVAQKAVLSGTQIYGGLPDKPDANRIYVENGKPVGAHKGTNYIKVTGTLNLAGRSNFELYKENDTDPFLLQFQTYWFDGVGAPELVSGIRFYLD